MKKILVLGAGHSAPFLIHHLLEQATGLDAEVIVGDLDATAAERRVGGDPRGRGMAFNVGDDELRGREIADADVVVSLLPPRFQDLVAEECLLRRTHMVSASYRSRRLRAMDEEARQNGVALLCELGLDPGVDVMSGERLIAGAHAAGGEVERFCSYGGGLPEPGGAGNPLDYCITWNPRNVVMAAHTGACYQRSGEFHLVPWERVFTMHWPVEVPGLGTLEAYANRDSLGYRDIHGLKNARTLVRATLRYPGWCDIWQQLVRLGLPNEGLEVPDYEEHTWRELVEMFLADRRPIDGVTAMNSVSPLGSPRGDNVAPPGSPRGDHRDVAERVADFLGLEAEDERLAKLAWLGLFSDERLSASTPAGALVDLLERKLPLPATARDLVVLYHEIDVVYAAEKRRERIRSTFLHYGEPGGFTAMAKGVGMPAALATKLLLEDRLRVRGALIPTHPEIYKPILTELERAGMGFNEATESLPFEPA